MPFGKAQYPSAAPPRIKVENNGSRLVVSFSGTANSIYDVRYVLNNTDEDASPNPSEREATDVPNTGDRNHVCQAVNSIYRLEPLAQDTYRQTKKD